METSLEMLNTVQAGVSQQLQLMTWLTVAVFVALIVLIVIAVKMRKENRTSALKPFSAIGTIGENAAPEAQVTDPQLIAVITAAVMAYEGGNGKNLVVRSVRRSGAWGNAGRSEAINY